MTKLQKLQVEQSEKREKLNAMLDKENLTDDERGELESHTKRLQEIEPELRAAIVADGEQRQKIATEFQTDAEGDEFRALLDRASAGAIFAAATEHRASDGPEKELQDHLKIKSNQIPLAMLRARTEGRAATAAPANVSTNQQPIIPQIFPMSVASFLGVDLPVVAVGESTFPIITTGADPAAPAAGGTVAETDGAFNAEVLSPSRLQASFFYRREDAAKFAGIDEALRTNLADALSSALDKQILTLTDKGLLEHGADPAAPAANAETFPRYRTALFDKIDGTYAAQASDVRLVVGATTYAHMASIYRGNNADDSALDSIMRVSGGVRVSGHVPAADNNVQQAVFARALGARHAVAPLWEGITLIPDEVTKAKTGEIVLTAVMLYGFAVVRADGFVRDSFRLA